MKRKITTLILVAAMVCSGFVCRAASGEQRFTYVKIPFEAQQSHLRSDFVARYADTKQPINLSMTYGDYMYATVPVQNAHREIEVFETEDVTFSDNDEAHYEFFLMEQLAKTGVIKGNEKGEALPFANVTRAEATAMILRFIGLVQKENLQLPFDDVAVDAWYYDTVATAYDAGIVMGDSDTAFSPYRNVSRQEATVMAARAIQYAGLCSYSTDAADIAKDYDQIAPWAVDAYRIIGGSYISDYDDTNPEFPVRVLNPQNPASRYDMAYMLYHTTYRCQLYPSDEAVEYGFDKEMPVIDGSTSTYPFTRSVYSALFSNGLAHPDMPVAHSKSHASYQRLINGEVDMLFASVYPASDILQMAEDKGVELELIPIAYDAMIFFTNIDNPAKGLTKQQISDIYVNNAYENWSQLGGGDALLYPYCRNNDSGSHAQMEKHFLGGNQINETIRKETTSVTMSNVLTDVMAARTTEPAGYGLGYSIYYYFNNMDMFYDTKTQLKLLEIDGVYPTDETIANGSYPLSNNTYIVLRGDTPEDAPARKMAEFMLTEAGQMCVENAGFGKLK